MTTRTPVRLKAPGEKRNLGYRSAAALTASGVTFRQLDYWARTHLVEPSVRPAEDSGSRRLYSLGDVVALRLVKTLLDVGLSITAIRDHLDAWEAEGWPRPLVVEAERVLISVDLDGITADVCYIVAGREEPALMWAVS